MKDQHQHRSTVPMRMAKTGYIVLSVMLCTLGLALILHVGAAASMLHVWCGAFFVVFGCVRILGFFSRDLYRLAFQFDLEFGILTALLGIFMLVRPGGPAQLIGIAFGILVLTDALFKIRITADARQFGISTWWVTLLLAAAAGVLGAALILRSVSRQDLLFLGITMIAEGALNLSTVLTMVRIVSHQTMEEPGRNHFAESEE